MGLWSKGVERSKTGEFRMEEDIHRYIAFIQIFLYKFFNEKNNFKVELVDDNMYLQIGCYVSGGRAKLKEKSHTGMMMCLLECVDDILVHTRDVSSFFVLRNKIDLNLKEYERTHVLKDLYFV